MAGLVTRPSLYVLTEDTFHSALCRNLVCLSYAKYSGKQSSAR